MEQNYKNYFNYKITKHLATISERGNVHRELNLVSFNGAPPKLDLRAWIYGTDNSVTIGKGLTLNQEEAQALLEALTSSNMAELFQSQEPAKEDHAFTTGTF